VQPSDERLEAGIVDVWILTDKQVREGRHWRAVRAIYDPAQDSAPNWAPFLTFCRREAAPPAIGGCRVIRAAGTVAELRRIGAGPRSWVPLPGRRSRNKFRNLAGVLVKGNGRRCGIAQGGITPDRLGFRKFRHFADRAAN